MQHVHEKAHQISVCLRIAAFNPRSSEYVRRKYKRKLMNFEETCELIEYLGSTMTKRYKEPGDRPIDFDFKLDKFVALKALPTNAQAWVS